jgi:hypothetical protein
LLHLTANSVAVFQSSVSYQSSLVFSKFVPILLEAGELERQIVRKLSIPFSLMK